MGKGNGEKKNKSSVGGKRLSKSAQLCAQMPCSLAQGGLVTERRTTQNEKKKKLGGGEGSDSKHLKWGVKGEGTARAKKG